MQTNDLMNGFLPVPSVDTTAPSSPQIVTSTDAEESIPTHETKWTQLLDTIFEDAKSMTSDQRKRSIYPFFIQFCSGVDVDRFSEKYLNTNSHVTTSSTKRDASSIVEEAVGEDNSSSDVGASPAKKKRKKKTDKPKDDKKLKEWSEKIRQIADESLPSLTDLQDIEKNFSEGKQKHISINYRFITEKKENHSEQVRHTYRNFFDRYPKLFYFFSYWTLNGKFKIIKSVFDESPELYKKCVTDVPDAYKKIWITQ
ncbi:hypothetical protein FDP41_010539 [Naegleria fowleri]|uniref:Uncharacterized protein n=1 Tax=Naegleria fowleri TaxID=5763 RepID=A0A6A5CAB1_NAEFO|nr:uncharacterized protein FDP41_010539 [Naegleria fowleri]KAF0983474.1 hypothetical protein FDP41_010539 [Naegleria fowleri]CAG4709793.1 unnamed protein product [Naegleria fowleri]